MSECSCQHHRKFRNHICECSLQRDSLEERTSALESRNAKLVEALEALVSAMTVPNELGFVDLTALLKQAREALTPKEDGK